jgi:hypothetical protein
MFSELEAEYPHLKETMLTAMGKVELARLLDVRYLDREMELEAETPAEVFPILT